MSATIEQWECPPLRARLSRAQCALNRRRAIASRDARRRRPTLKLGEEPTIAEIRLRECLNCKGVAWWAEQMGRGPRRISADEVVADHVRGEERRARMTAGLGALELAR
jgi:hypothetical protein